jgi:hypothetical protein
VEGGGGLFNIDVVKSVCINKENIHENAYNLLN